MSFECLPTTLTEPIAALPVIEVSGLSKCFQIYSKPSDRLLQLMVPAASRLFGVRGKRYFREFWALRDASFNIAAGEVVGIVGRNGSGKSTLLQLICGTLTPTHGEVIVRGRVAALLELGSGFTPEFTGRENVYLNAAVIGLSKQETDEKFDEILEFADIGAFIDEPIKTYSSGMTVRLAFAVAINADPSVLVVDEALAVGDELFQRKCFARLEAMRSRGVTILFVSHAAGTVIELCDRAILLDGGELLMQSDPRSVIRSYHKLLYAPSDQLAEIRQQIACASLESPSLSPEHEASPDSDSDSNGSESSQDETFDPAFVSQIAMTYSSNGAAIADVGIFSSGGLRVNGLVRGREYFLRYRVWFDRSLFGVRFGMLIKSVTGVHLGGALSHSTLGEGLMFQADDSALVEFRFRCHLNPGVYFVNAGVFGIENEAETLLHRIADAAVFRVLPSSDQRPQEMIDFGCVARISSNA